MNDSELTELALAGAALFLRRSMYDLQQHARQAGISLAQMHVLLHLYARGPSEVMALVDVMQASPAGASQMVERLTLQDLVQRQEKPGDRRVRQVHLTAKGQQVVESSLVGRRQWLEDLLASLAEDEKEVIGRVLQSLKQRMGEHEQRHHPHD